MFVLSATNLRIRWIPKPLAWWCAAGLAIPALAGSPVAMARAVVGASVLSGLLHLTRGLGARLHDGASGGIRGGDIGMGVPLGLLVGWSVTPVADAVAEPLLVAGLASLLALFVLAFRALVIGRGSWRDPSAFGPWLCSSPSLSGPDPHSGPELHLRSGGWLARRPESAGPGGVSSVA